MFFPGRKRRIKWLRRIIPDEGIKDYNEEWWDPNTKLKKYNSLIFISRKDMKLTVSVFVREREKERGDGYRRRTAILTLIFFLVALCHTQGLTWHFYFSARDATTPFWALAGPYCDSMFPVTAVTAWLAVTAVGVSIYDFPTPIHSLSCLFGCQLRWAASNHALLSSCLHSWNTLPQDSLIDGPVKVQYATLD